MCNVTGNRAVIVILSDDDVGGLLPTKLTDLGHDSAQDLVIHPGRIDRIDGPRSIRVIGGIRLLRPEDGQVRLLVWQNIVDENVRQVGEAAPGKRSSAVEGISGLPILESLNGNRSCRVAVILGERQRTRRIRIAAVSRKRVPGLLQFLGETKRNRRVFVENDPAALVILDEGGAELADSRCCQPFGLCGLKRC